MYVVMIGLLILVFSSLLPKNKSSASKSGSPELMKEMEETMEGFLAELEEDNQKLIGTMTAMKQEHEAAVRKLSDRVDLLEQQLREQSLEWNRLTLQRLERQEAEQAERDRHPASVGAVMSVQAAGSAGTTISSAKTELVPDEPPVMPVTIRSRYEELFRMHDEGKSVEYIAKKSGMNKGEVQLIIQLAVQEERKGVQK
ncbi:hypothetical protein [Gorillibacterium sp. sgz5001074]|uniref:hypothetical protein n=1 Tax=Gorillibacterium sp. sgz5001074 TaxID=3446695 RepID=UPI003F680317